MMTANQRIPNWIAKNANDLTKVILSNKKLQTNVENST